MTAKFIFLTVIVAFLYCTKSYSQDTSYTKIEFEEIPIKNKHSFTVWRVDYYICTGIAYAKSVGQSVEDFAKFVGKHHDITNRDDETLSGVAKTGHLLITNYPWGKYEIISQSDSVIVAKSNRPYKGYSKNGPMLGVTIDEFEKYLWGHAAIMASKINIDFKYEISENEVIQTYSYK